MKTISVKIPFKVDGEILSVKSVVISNKCPVCGGKRGRVFDTISHDGRRQWLVNGWRNNCKHIDLYSDVYKEALNNGLNIHLDKKAVA